MHLIKHSRTLAAAGVVAALVAPAVVQAKPGHGHGHGAPTASQGIKPIKVKYSNVIVKGSVAAVDGDVVTVTAVGGNHRGRGLAGQPLLLDLSKARVTVRDVNQDGARNAADVAVGDRVLVQVRVP